MKNKDFAYFTSPLPSPTPPHFPLLYMPNIVILYFLKNRFVFIISTHILGKMALYTVITSPAQLFVFPEVRLR